MSDLEKYTFDTAPILIKMGDIVNESIKSSSSISDDVYARVLQSEPQIARRSPLSRRRAGDRLDTVDTPGFWVHVESKSDGIPYEARTIEVTDDLSQWRLTNSAVVEWRLLERLPKTGSFIFLW